MLPINLGVKILNTYFDLNELRIRKYSASLFNK